LNKSKINIKKRYDKNKENNKNITYKNIEKYQFEREDECNIIYNWDKKKL